MKKIITKLFTNFTIVTSTTLLMNNNQIVSQITDQQIENMKTKIDSWIIKTNNWEQYLEPEYETGQLNKFIKTYKTTNSDEISCINPISLEFELPVPKNKQWFNQIIYRPVKMIDFEATITTIEGRLIKKIKIDDCPLISIINNNDLNGDKVIAKNRFIITTCLNNNNLSLKISFLYDKKQRKNENTILLQIILIQI